MTPEEMYLGRTIQLECIIKRLLTSTKKNLSDDAQEMRKRGSNPYYNWYKKDQGMRKCKEGIETAFRRNIHEGENLEKAITLRGWILLRGSHWEVHNIIGRDICRQQGAKLQRNSDFQAVYQKSGEETDPLGVGWRQEENDNCRKKYYVICGTFIHYWWHYKYKTFMEFNINIHI